jgi:stage II sporulation protein D
VQLFRQARGRILAVNVVPLEDYIASVLDSEMPADFPPAARQAQAIVARTYALYELQESRDHPYFDVFASTRSQKYLGAQYRDLRGRLLAGESESSRQAVAQTAGMVCTYHGRVFSTYYTAACGGRTTAGREVFRDAAPPLSSVSCDWCCESRFYRWSTETSRTQLDEALHRCFASRKLPFDGLATIAIARNSARDGVPVLNVSDGTRRLSVSAADLRRELSSSTLPSPNFLVRDAGDVIHFEGRGHGHCVGFCQWGARGQALAGHTPLDIIRYYYRDAEIVSLDGSPR